MTMGMTMVRFRLIGAAALLGALGACAQPAPAPLVVDPYAGRPGGAFTGDLAGLGATAEDFRNTAGDTVLFSQDQSSLGAEARATLVRQADWLKRNGNFASVVEGHSDEQGTREYNLALGARRAGAVQEYLISQGVEAGRITTRTMGKERPLEVCSTPECYDRNRRAVTIVQPGLGV